MRHQARSLLRSYVRSECRLRLLTYARNNATLRPFSSSPLPRQEDQNQKFVLQRKSQLGGDDDINNFYPRLSDTKDLPNERLISPMGYLQSFGTQLERLEPGKSLQRPTVTVVGRIKSKRAAGRDLCFVDIEGDGQIIQTVLNRNAIVIGKDEKPSWDIQTEIRNIQRGDWIAVTGLPHRSDRGEYSVLVIEKPRLLAPALRHVPGKLPKPGFLSHNRHIDRIVNPSSREILTFRHHIIASLRWFFYERHFTEVNTPLLMRRAGGANARPFETVATEFSDQKLQLRIAPELHLKRLMIGNMGKIFEIGPSFRNEGIDAVHNPEFYTCEFYQSFTNLKQLMRTTQELFSHLEKTAKETVCRSTTIPDPSTLGLEAPFQTLRFIPSIEQAIRIKDSEWSFPDLSNHDHALETLKSALAKINPKYDLNTTSSLPTLLDTFSSTILEPTITRPTWITHHPECMSPLAKSFRDEACPGKSGLIHTVSARAELFINGKEYVNCYEEENNPFEQRRKFVEQNRFRRQEGKMEGNGDSDVDESYIRALEWGLPPTGGWGCGVDRLVMLFSGRKRIADVLPFGNLANVIGMG